MWMKRLSVVIVIKIKAETWKAKKLFFLATEKLEDGRTGNIRMQQIENFEALTLKFALKDIIDNTWMNIENSIIEILKEFKFAADFFSSCPALTQMFLELLTDLFAHTADSLLDQFQEDGSSDYYTWYIRLLTAGNTPLPVSMIYTNC